MELAKVLKSKTIWFALLLSIFGVLETQISALQPFMSQQAFGLFSMFVGIVIAILRFMTTMPISEK